MMRVRPASVDELPALQDIEWAAGQCFADIGIPELADDEPLTLAPAWRHRAISRRCLPYAAWPIVDGPRITMSYSRPSGRVAVTAPDPASTLTDHPPS
jgi:hypothetical protein